MSARLMRRVLVDIARSKHAQKRGWWRTESHLHRCARGVR
jgi:hypothetical protein